MVLVVQGGSDSAWKLGSNLVNLGAPFGASSKSVILQFYIQKVPHFGAPFSIKTDINRGPILGPFLDHFFLDFRGPFWAPFWPTKGGPSPPKAWTKTEPYWTWLGDLPFTGHAGFLVAPRALLGDILAARRVWKPLLWSPFVGLAECAKRLNK